MKGELAGFPLSLLVGLRLDRWRRIMCCCYAGAQALFCELDKG